MGGAIFGHQFQGGRGVLQGGNGKVSKSKQRREEGYICDGYAPEKMAGIMRTQRSTPLLLTYMENAAIEP